MSRLLMKNNKYLPACIRLLTFVLSVIISPLANADLDSLHDTLWREILHKIEKTYPLPGSVVWNDLNFESINFQKASNDLSNLLINIRNVTNPEAKACHFLSVHNFMSKLSLLAVSNTYNPSNIKPEWYKKEKQLNDLGIKIVHAGIPETIAFMYRGDLGNELKELYQTHCGQIYSLFSYRNEHQAHRNMPSNEWNSLIVGINQYFESKHVWSNKERAIGIIYEISILLDQWTNCGLFDPTQEEIDRFWIKRYTDELMINKILLKLNELNIYIPNRQGAEELLYLLKNKQPADTGWSNFCEPDDV